MSSTRERLGKFLLVQPVGGGWWVFNRRVPVQILGKVFWFEPYKGHVFEPNYGAVLSVECMRSVTDFLARQNALRKDANVERGET